MPVEATLGTNQCEQEADNDLQGSSPWEQYQGNSWERRNSRIRDAFDENTPLWPHTPNENGVYTINGRNYVGVDGIAVRIQGYSNISGPIVIDSSGNPISDAILVRISAHSYSVGSLRGGGACLGKPQAPKNRSLMASSLSQPDSITYILFEKEQRKNLQTMLTKRTQLDPGSHDYTITDIERKNFPIPDTVYRGHGSAGNTQESGLLLAPGAEAREGDAYLAAIIKHTACTGGSAGQVMSLSSSALTAQQYAQQSGGVLVNIATTSDPAAFRSISDILAKDGPRLVTDRLITQATFYKALDQLSESNERELFYVKGDIPASFISIDA